MMKTFLTNQKILAIQIFLQKNFQKVNITITDLNGKQIQSSSYYNTQLLKITLNEAAGLYLVNIKSENSRAVFKLLIE